MHPGYIEYDKLLLFSELYHLYIKERGICFNFTMTLNFQTLSLPVTVEIRAYKHFITFHQYHNIFMCVYVCIIIQAMFRPYLYGRTNMVHNSLFRYVMHG